MKMAVAGKTMLKFWGISAIAAGCWTVAGVKNTKEYANKGMRAKEGSGRTGPTG